MTFEYETERESPTGIEQVGTGSNLFTMGITNYLNFAYGNIWFVPLVSLCGLFIIFRKRGNYILIILSVLSFLLLFYYSYSPGSRAEDTSRAMLGMVTTIGLICAMYLERVYKFLKKYHKILAIAFFIIIIYFSFSNLNTKLVTMKLVKQFSPTFLEACDHIEKNTEKDAWLMTIWAHQSSYNCQRKIAGFWGWPDSGDIILSGDLNLTLSRLNVHGITHIFIQKFSISSTPTGEKYPISFIQFLEDNSESFINVYENGPPLQDCLQAGGCDGNVLYEIDYEKIS